MDNVRGEEGGHKNCKNRPYYTYLSQGLWKINMNGDQNSTQVRMCDGSFGGKKYKWKDMDKGVEGGGGIEIEVERGCNYYLYPPPPPLPHHLQNSQNINGKTFQCLCTL